MLYRIIKQKPQITIKAVHDEERFPLGFTSVYIVEEQGEPVGELLGIMRYPNYKGKGICKAMANQAITYCREYGCHKVKVKLYYKRRGLTRLFRSLGFLENTRNASQKYRVFEKILTKPNL